MRNARKVQAYIRVLVAIRSRAWNSLRVGFVLFTLAGGTGFADEPSEKGAPAEKGPKATTPKKMPTKPAPATSAEYDFTAVAAVSTRAPAAMRTVNAGGRTWKCLLTRERTRKVTRCTVRAPASLLNVASCRALAEQVGPIERYGHSGARLTASQLTRCNATVSKTKRPTTATSRGRERVEPSRTPDTGSPLGRMLDPAELAIRTARVDSGSLLIPGGYAVIGVEVENTGDIVPNVKAIAGSVKSGTGAIPARRTRWLHIRMPISDSMRGNEVETVIQLAKADGSRWTDANSADNSRTLRFRIGRPEMAITGVRRASANPVHPGDRGVELVVNVRNTGNAAANVGVATVSGARGSHGRDIQPGRTAELRISVDIPDRIRDSEFRDEVHLLLAAEGRGTPLILGEFRDSNPADNRRQVRIPIVINDLVIDGVNYRWTTIRGSQHSCCGNHFFYFTIRITNISPVTWNYGGYVRVALYRGTPESTLSLFGSTEYSVPPINIDRAAAIDDWWYLRREDHPLTHRAWYTLRAQLHPNAADGDRTNDCFQMVGFLGDTLALSHIRRSRFNCARMISGR
jgi:hypothetical protein